MLFVPRLCETLQNCEDFSVAILQAKRICALFVFVVVIMDDLYDGDSRGRVYGMDFDRCMK